MGPSRDLIKFEYAISELICSVSPFSSLPRHFSTAATASFQLGDHHFQTSQNLTDLKSQITSVKAEVNCLTVSPKDRWKLSG